MFRITKTVRTDTPLVFLGFVFLFDDYYHQHHKNLHPQNVLSKQEIALTMAGQETRASSCQMGDLVSGSILSF